MSNVVLSIGGRAFTVASADGEEGHVAALGRMIDTVVSTGNLRTQTEPRMLLYAALMLADELHEARQALASVPATAEPVPAPVPAEPDPALEERVARIAVRLEAVAQHLEDRAPSA
ncbi:cell division protein ZapA [Novosphingobium chloroacetimidivorans]|uniref:Cell division protein ZapA n=1 Tax=Novosphingobium chloroacetimidivorans TaxID=1428314 RepID=A0A7W7NW99_9SPHN|nr:cell division protein ZapA [Novosphingobium chloroacetimidivorans]MBB4859101.1 cell division protein ZapA [Novosphingobium chloroacetimidivorans]